MPLHIYMPTYFSCYAQLYEIIRVSTIVCSHITGNCVNTAPHIMLCPPPPHLFGVCHVFFFTQQEHWWNLYGAVRSCELCTFSLEIVHVIKKNTASRLIFSCEHGENKCSADPGTMEGVSSAKQAVCCFPGRWSGKERKNNQLQIS